MTPTDKWVREKSIQREQLRSARRAFGNRRRTKDKKKRKVEARAKRKRMPRFHGRWRGRLIHHWKRSPSKFEIDSAFLDRLWIAQEGRCAYCECAIDDETLVLEHMNPLSRGGRTSEDNVCFACVTCNGLKLAMPFEAWCERIGWKA